MGLENDILTLSHQLRIDRIGFASLEAPVSATIQSHYQEWLSKGYQAEMCYLEKHSEIRNDPRLLLPGAQSIIACAVSYYPQEQQPRHAPRIAKYAYGRDYHKIFPKLLHTFAHQIDTLLAPHSFRVCVDTAPIHERYWAWRAGLGFIGRNRNLIIPGIGSYVFLGEILTTLRLSPLSSPIRSKCGKCRRCIESCPTQALTLEGIDARRCISYLTIEHKGDIPSSYTQKMGCRLYGCDTCQEVCPHNRTPTPEKHFPTAPQILTLRTEDLLDFDRDKYSNLCRGSAMTRAKYEGMTRNVQEYLRLAYPNKSDEDTLCLKQGERENSPR